MKLLIAENLTILRNNKILLRKINLEINSNEIIHLRGENGTGKTTLLQILAGLNHPMSGEIHSEPLIYLGHGAGISQNLTPFENLRFIAQLHHHLLPENLELIIKEALNIIGLGKHTDRQARFLSAGQQRRIQLARLWLPTNAKIWLLDEPFTALDIYAAQHLIARCQEFAATGGGVLLTSHQEFLGATRVISL